MAYASTSSRIPVLLRPRDFQWYWNSTTDPWSGEVEWMKYADVENEIIEDAYNEKKADCEIDRNYVVNFNHEVQYRKAGRQKQRPIKRVQLDRDRSNAHLREERFSLPMTVISTQQKEEGEKMDDVTSAQQIDESDKMDDVISTQGIQETTDSYDHLDPLEVGLKKTCKAMTDSLAERCEAIIRTIHACRPREPEPSWRNTHFPQTYYNKELEFKNKTVADVVGEAAEGIIKQGTALDKTHVAHWLAEQLLAVKQSGANVNVHRCWDTHIPCNIDQTSVYLYTKESFWYKLINRVLRGDIVTGEHVRTLGPFCWLLHCYLRQNKTTNIPTVYRGLYLTNEQQQPFMKKDEGIKFTSFTSTSRNREKAEQFGNTLLVIDLNVKKYLLLKDKDNMCGAEISHLSDFHDEEEFLIWPATYFYFVKYKYDAAKKKHVIYLKSSGSND